MKAQRLPSGNYRVRIPVGKKKDGRPEVKSFTAKTEREALAKAALYRPDLALDMTVGEAAEQYIDLKAAVLSPSTFAGYKKILKNYLDPAPIAAVKLDHVTSPIVQKWVSGMAKKLSPKTVRNAFGFFSAVMAMYAPDVRFRAKLPQRKPQTLYTPTTADINAVLDEADPVLKIAILLGATAMMRRGEICALTSADVDYKRNLIIVRRALVRDRENNYVVKLPKTEGSFRIVEVNPEVIAMLPRKGILVDLTPDVITKRFETVIKRAGVHPFRFHDLRHYAASIAVSSAIGAGSLTVQDRGGWSTDSIMKRVYTHSVSDQAKKDTGKIIQFFSKNIHFG